MEAKRFAVKGINIQAGGEYDTFEQIEPAADAGVRVYNIGLSEVVEDTEFYRKVLEQDVRSYSKFRQKKVAYAVIEAEKVLFTARLLKSKQALKCDLG